MIGEVVGEAWVVGSEGVGGWIVEFGKFCVSTTYR